MFLAGGLAIAQALDAIKISRLHPFGIIDVADQYVPLHTYFWDLLHQSNGGANWYINWHAGMGEPFIPSYGFYLSSVMSPLVALFPREQMDLAVFLLVVLKTGLAAAFTQLLIMRLFKAVNPLIALVLSLGYANCTWVLNTGLVAVIWVDGLWLLPILFLLIAEAKDRKNAPYLLLLAEIILWWSNFYTAWFAMLGSGAWFLFLLWWYRKPWRDMLIWVMRVGLPTLLAPAICAVLLYPSYLAAVNAPETATIRTKFDTFDEAHRFFGFLPFTARFGVIPGASVGILGVSLCIALLLSKKISNAVKVTVLVGGIIVWLSLAFPGLLQLILLNKFPHGIPFRYSYVFALFVTIGAAYACNKGVLISWEAVIANLGLLALFWYVYRHPDWYAHVGVIRTDLAMASYAAVAAAIALYYLHRNSISVHIRLRVPSEQLASPTKYGRAMCWVSIYQHNRAKDHGR